MSNANESKNSGQKKNKPNVVLVVIDALRWDVLKWALANDMVPNLKKLEEFGSYKDNHFTVSSPTQFSFSSLLSSRRPLSDNGYEDGVLSRPVVAAEVFKKNGYKTYGFTSCSDLSPYHGYDRGFDEYYFNCDPQAFARRYTVEIERVWDLKKNESISEEKAKRLIAEKTERFLVSCDSYISSSVEKDKSLKVCSSNKSSFLDLRDACEEYRKNRKKESGDIDLCLVFFEKLKKLPVNDSFLKVTVYVQIAWLLKSFKAVISVLPYKDPARCARVLYRWIKNARVKDKQAAQPGRLMTKQFDLVFSNKKECPRYFFLHYYDVHDRRVYNFLEKRARFVLPKHMTKLPNFLLTNPGYLMGLVNLDHEIGGLIGKVKNDDKETVLVLTSDHGMPMEGIAEYKPERRYKGFSVANAYFDETYNVPFYFGFLGNENFNKTPVMGMSTSIDVLPTMIDAANLKVEPLFEGRSLLAKDELAIENLVISENMGRGAGIFGAKRIHIMVRDLYAKVVCSFPPGESLLNYRVDDVYLLDSDPGEAFNETDVVANNPVVRRLVAKACLRARVLKKGKPSQGINFPLTS